MNPDAERVCTEFWMRGCNLNVGVASPANCFRTNCLQSPSINPIALESVIRKEFDEGGIVEYAGVGVND